MSIISDPEKQKLYRLCVLRSALNLEIKGLKRRGRSAYAIVKEELNIRGDRERVLKQLIVKIKEIEDAQGITADRGSSEGSSFADTEKTSNRHPA